MAETEVQSIQCKAAVSWEVDKPITIETIEVAPPQPGEIRIKMIYTGVCHSDLSVLNGSVQSKLPIVLGHEGAGVVESVGEGVTDLKVGDHVLPLFVPQCDNCVACKSGKTNICDCMLGPKFAMGIHADGGTRFKCKEQQLSKFLSCGTFSQYIVLPEMSVCKIDPTAPLDKVCLLACGIATGYGAALNTAKVDKGSTCAIWGLGPIGLAVAMGCKKAGASRIIGIDLNSDKFELGKKFGLTEGINPKDHDKPIHEVLMGMTGGGLDYAFECIGNVEVMKTAFNSTRVGWGKTIVLGMAPTSAELSTNPLLLTFGKTITGSIYGEWRGKKDVPTLIESYNKKDLLLDEFVTHEMGLDRINEAFDLMKQSKSLRTVISLWPEEE